MKFFFVLCCISILMYSCNNCERNAESYRSDDFEVILTESPEIDGDLFFVGRRINSYKVSKIVIEQKWYRKFIHSMDIGDTVIKRKDELTLYIHKKDTVLSFDWECKGKTYK